MKKNNSVLSKLLISYSLILIVPFIGFVAMYSWIRATVENYAVKLNEEIIRNAYEEINEVIEKVNVSLLSIAANTHIDDISKYTTLEEEEYFECYLMQKELAKLLNSNEDIYHIYVYFPQADICVFETTTMKADKFFERYYGMNMEESAAWKEKLLQTKFSAQANQSVKEGSVIPVECVDFIKPYPIGYKYVSAISVISVREDVLFDSLNREDTVSEFMIVNDENSLLFHSTDTEKILEEMIVFVNGGGNIESDKERHIMVQQLQAKWKLYCITDKERLFEGLNKVRTVSSLLIVLYICLCVWLIQNFTKRNYEPIRNLLKLISDKRQIEYQKNTNEIDWLQNVYSSMNEENERFSSLLKQQRTLVLEKFLRMLLKGRVNPKEWEERTGQFGIKVISDDYVVVLFKINEPESVFSDNSGETEEQDKLDLAYFIINNIATEVLSKNYMVLSVNVNDSVVCIINYAEQEEDIINEIYRDVEDIKSAVHKYFAFKFLTIISSEQSSYGGIHEAYKQVLDGLHYQLLYQKDAIICCSKLNDSVKTNYYYPLEIENNLINCIKNGNYDEAENIVDELFKRNVEHLEMNKVMAKCFMSDLMATMVKAVGEVVPELGVGEETEITDTMNDLLNSENLYEMKSCVKLLMDKVRVNISSKSGRDTTDRIIQFIEENYPDCQLSVTSLAEQFNLHPVYLSSLFKKRTGEKLLDYITRYRVDRAKSLIKAQKNISLDDVGRLVGYDNIRTFARVFKKYEGITPAQYKKNID